MFAQLVAAPETFHETVPTGAGFPLVPVTRAVKVNNWPSVAEVGVPLTKIVGVAATRFTDMAPEVIAE